jgi:hypothetical protein
VSKQRKQFSNRLAAWAFMAEQHPTFERANQDTASAIVDAVVKAAGAAITAYDEGNPGSSHLVRVHTTNGTIWINPGRVFVPDSMPSLDSFESVPAANGNGVDYLLPHAGSHTRGAPTSTTPKVCPNCGITLPLTGVCDFCG